jgi:predicted NAD-dependent protein-ADP-ribosyltransferase YbiA (DUF1768 family)
MIHSFTGAYEFLSNFYIVDIGYECQKYPTVGHAFQAAKASDPIARAQIRSAATAAAAKKLGRRVASRGDNHGTNQASTEGPCGTGCAL